VFVDCVVSRFYSLTKLQQI